jgi:hypothetical protein
MQAGSGGRTKLSVVSFQFLVRSRQRLFVLGSASFRCDAKEVVSSQFSVKGGKRFFCGGLGKLRLGRKDGLGELFTARRFAGMRNSTTDARQPYRGVPTKFHLPQAKDSCSGRK